MHITSKKDYTRITSLLLDRGIEADMSTKHGVCALHIASKEGNIATVDQLLDHGASPAIHTVVRFLLYFFANIFQKHSSHSFLYYTSYIIF